MLAYLFDGTLDGLFCAVFLSYTHKEVPDTVIQEEYLQLGFDQKIRMVETEQHKAERVAHGLRQKAGEEVFNRLWTAFLAPEVDKVGLLRYIRLGFEVGRPVYDMLAHPDVNPIMKACTAVEREAQHLRGFVRLSLMENGVYFGRFRPTNNVMPMLMPHFADRFQDQPFVLYDPVHQIAGVYPMDEWYLVHTDQITLPEEAENESEWKALWTKFYHAIGIKERRNERLRRNMCPRQYWGDMVEMRGEK